MEALSLLKQGSTGDLKAIFKVIFQLILTKAGKKTIPPSFVKSPI